MLLLSSTLLIACGDTTLAITPSATVVTATTAVADSPTLAIRPGYIVGDTKRLGSGLVQSWVKVDAANKPVAVGLAFSTATLIDLPDSFNNQLPLQLPTQASATAFNHLSLDWNPKGHEPAGIYDKPHFDVHFYLLSQEERSAILPTGDLATLTKSPPSETVPVGYAPPPGPVSPASIVPGQGVHWGDTTSPEFRGQPFTQTFIFGFANAKLGFFEPMISKAFLETKPDFSSDIKQPTVYSKTGVAYPTRYSIKYDAANKEYLVALEDFINR